MSGIRKSIDYEAFGRDNEDLSTALLNDTLTFPVLQLPASRKGADVGQAGKIVIHDCKFDARWLHFADSAAELEKGMRQALRSRFCSQSHQSIRVCGQIMQNYMQGILSQNVSGCAQRPDLVATPNQQFTILNGLRGAYIVYRRRQQGSDPKRLVFYDPPEENLLSFLCYSIILYSSLRQEKEGSSTLSSPDNHPICRDNSLFGGLKDELRLICRKP